MYSAREDKRGKPKGILSPDTWPVLITCCVGVKVRALVSNVARGLQARSLGRGLAGISLSHANLYLKGTLGDVLACKQHRHLENVTDNRRKLLTGLARNRDV